MLRLAVVVALASLALAPSVAAQQAQPGWIADSRTGCRVWNSDPQPKQTIAWSGGCVDGKATGRGALQWYADGKPTDRYEGDYRDGKRHGRGVAVWANGNRYEGEWRDDAWSGRGVFAWANGDRYDGEWRDGKEHGRGAYRSGDGEVGYDGAWSNGKPDGDGVGTYRGEDYAGSWSNGCFRQGARRLALFSTEAECGFR